MARYIFGGNTGETPETIARKRALAERIMGQSPAVAPRSTLDGIGNAFASIMEGVSARSLRKEADSGEQAGLASANTLFDSIVSSITTGAPLSYGGSPAPVPGAPSAAPQASAPTDYASQRVATAHGDMGPFRDAIASIESAGSGDYQAIGPKHPRLGRALGRYQVMEANVGPWTEKYLGRRLTPEEFLASPEAQDAVFDGEFGSYVERFGDPALAAQAWFAGPGGVGTSRQDSLGTSVPEYAQKFTAALGRNPGQQAIQSQLESLPVGGSMVMPRPEQIATGPAQADSVMPFTPQSPTPEGAAPPPVQVADASGGMPPMPNAAPGDGLDLQTLIQAASNPWLNEGQRAVVNSLIQQKMQEQEAARAQQMRAQTAHQVGIDPRFAGDDEVWKAAVGQQFRDPTTDIQEYEYARNQGFTGSFTEFQEAKRRAGAINVDARTMGNIPPGYHVEYDEAGNPVRMMPVPGGPAWQEQQEAESAAEAARRNAASYARTVTQDIGIADDYLSQIGDFAGGDGIVGANIRAYRSGIPGTPEYNMRQFVESALNNVTLDTMNRMRESSPAGATGFGNMSERQMEVIRGVLGQWKPGLPIDDQRYILHRLGNFYLDVQFGTKHEREQALRDGRMTPGENAAIEELYYPETRDIRGRKLDEGNGELPEGVTEADIEHTMRKHGLSREEVLRRIRQR